MASSSDRSKRSPCASRSIRGAQVSGGVARLRLVATLAAVAVALVPAPVRCQITPDEANQIKSAISARIEALTILGGDYGLTGGDFRSTGKFQSEGNSDAELVVTKLGGAGDFGLPQPIDAAGIGWQGRLQGNMGYVEASNHFHSQLLAGDVNTFKTFAVQFGGGVRFWVTDKLSFAPIVLGMYGTTTNSYTANSAFMQANLARATELGLVDWNVDTWGVRTSINIQYLFLWGRTRIKLSSEPIYYHTQSFNSSNPNVNVTGDSEAVVNTIDIDIPLGVELWGHELRTGGDISRTDLFGDLRQGLALDHVNEIHPRLVLDFLNQLWKVQWIGLGASYVWGPNFTGWTAGLDVVFRF